jgi:hypothetical protein
LRKKKEKPYINVADNISQLVISRHNEGWSTYRIAEELGPGYYPNKINRILRKAGVKPHSRSKAQKLNLASGRSKHPTEGKKRTYETKLKISKGISETYRSDPSNKEKRSAISKELWAEKSEAEKANLSHKAAVGVRKAAVEGSRIEKYIVNQLKKMHYDVNVHTKLFFNQALEVDIFIPALNSVIECDGPSHSQPIYGEEAFQKTQRSDAEKNGLVMQKYNLIRLQTLSKKYTAAYARRVWDRLIEKLWPIIQKNGELLPIEERFILIKEEI